RRSKSSFAIGSPPMPIRGASSSSPSCRRRSPARSGGSSYAKERRYSLANDETTARGGKERPIKMRSRLSQLVPSGHLLDVNQRAGDARFARTGVASTRSLGREASPLIE